MARNVEIKARVDDLALVRTRATPLATAPATTFAQDDTFFAAQAGRLKLRRFADGRAELIAYRRSDREDAKLSEYEIVPVPDADRLHRALALACGEFGRVVKRRTLVLAGRTRIHLDDVLGLGTFVELEVADGEPESAGVAEADRVLAALGVAAEARVRGAYVDLLRAARGLGTAEAPN
jgi:adenylate cyclase class IV